MKKNYSTPEFTLVALEPNDIVCDSLTGGGDWDYQNGRPSSDAKQRGGGIWDE